MSEPHSPPLTFRFFAGTSREELAEAFEVREAVFVQEQGIDPDLELDEYDYIAWHAVARVGDRPVATARFVTLDVHTGKIGRVAVLPEFRRQGIAGRLLDLLEEYARREGLRRLVLDSQLTARELYAKHGFAEVGEYFLDAGIPHVRMVKDLPR